MEKDKEIYPEFCKKVITTLHNSLWYKELRDSGVFVGNKFV
jgi:hypothetical protein